jgi:hypothetical protein
MWRSVNVKKLDF